jgi:hypothetical protein
MVMSVLCCVVLDDREGTMGMQFNVGSRVVHPCHLAYSVDNSRPALERCSIATYQVVFHIMSRVRCTGSYASRTCKARVSFYISQFEVVIFSCPRH